MSISADGWFSLVTITVLVTWTIRHGVQRWYLAELARVTAEALKPPPTREETP